GKEGIDFKNAYMDWELPDHITKQAEGIIQGNTGSIRNKEFYDDGSPEAVARRIALGSGASEYTKNNERAVYGGVLPENAKGKALTGDDALIDPESVFEKRRIEKAATTTDATKVGKSLKNMTREEEVLHYMKKASEAAPNIGDEDGRALTALKTIVMGTAKMIGEGVDGAAELGADIMEEYMIADPETRNNLRAYFDVSEKEWEESFSGTMQPNQRYQKEADKDLAKYADKGDWFGVAGSFARNWDVHLANSAPESIAIATGGMMRKAIGLALVASGRTNKATDEYKENFGEEMDKGRAAVVFALNAANLKLDEVLFLTPLGKAFKSAVQGVGAKQLKTMFYQQARSMGFEAAQETADQAIETWAGKDEMISAKDAKIAAIGGAVMSAQMNAPGVIMTAPGAIANDAQVYGEYRDQNKRETLMENIDSGLDTTDKNFAELDAQATIDISEEGIARMESSAEEINKILKSEDNDLVANGKKSENKDVSSLFSAAENATYIDDASEIKVENQTFKDVIELAQISAAEIINSTNDVAKKFVSDNDITIENANEKFAALLIDPAIRGDAISMLLNTGMIAQDTLVEMFDESKKIDGNRIRTKVEEELNSLSLRGKVEKTMNKQKEIAKSKTFATKSKPRVTGKVDTAITEPVDSSSKTSMIIDLAKAVGSIALGASDIITGKNRKSKMQKKLEAYDSNSLREAKKTAGTKAIREIDKVLEGRTKAKKDAGLDSNTKGNDTKSEEYIAVENTDVSFADKATALVSLKEVLKRKEFQNTKESGFVNKRIDRALADNFITQKQADILKGRNEKIALRTKQSMLKKRGEVIEAQKKADEAKNRKIKSKEESKSTGKKYTFKTADGQSHIGDIITEWKDTTVVEYTNKDGEVERINFYSSNGREVMTNGEVGSRRAGKKVTEATDTDIDERTGKPLASNTGNSESENNANRLANNEFSPMQSLTDEDIVEMTDAEFEAMKDIINQILCE
ncbi:MAG: hypothetical protein KAH01_05340, partial [Caldisericia bacterium]|nr:hypothetical protein [Caldisericia bacterium]